jgi:hypothetical protein
MGITLKIKNVKDDRYLTAIMEILNRHYDVKASYYRPHLSLTYEIKIEGTEVDFSKEKNFEYDLRSFASTVGWQAERA